MYIILEVFHRKHQPLERANIDLRCGMPLATKLWRRDAQLQPIVRLACELLRLYDDKPENMTTSSVLADIQIMWMEVIDWFIDAGPERRILEGFRHGGRVRDELLNPELSRLLKEIHHALRSRIDGEDDDGQEQRALVNDSGKRRKLA